HNFVFFVGSSLEMEATHSSSETIVRNTLLSDLGIQTSYCEFMSTPSAGEESTVIFSALDIDQECTLQSSRSKKHVAHPLPICCSRGRQKKLASICSVAIRCFNCSNRVKPRSENISLVILIYEKI